jgi:hypothetical protein
MAETQPERIRTTHMGMVGGLDHDAIIRATCDVAKNARDPLGDGDQTPLSADPETPGQLLRQVWCEGGDLETLCSRGADPVAVAVFVGDSNPSIPLRWLCSWEIRILRRIQTSHKPRRR